MSRNLVGQLFTGFAIALLIPMLGCQSESHPWVGKPYQRPGSYVNPPTSIYAPMPSILPAISASDITGDQSQDAELESVLMDLENLNLDPLNQE